MLVLFVADLRDPFGGPGIFTDVQVTVQQPLSGYFNQIVFSIETPAPLGPGPIPPIPLDLGTIFPEPRQVENGVVGP